MVIAVVGLSKGSAIALRRRGVRDSKDFGSGVEAKRRRAELASIITERAECFALRVVTVEEVDAHTFRGELNVLERIMVLELLAQLRAPADARIVCDGALIFGSLRQHFPGLRAMNGGEAVHVSVAAASIVAKDARDTAFAEIAARYDSEFGPVTGGGYLNAATRRFLSAYVARYGCLPPEARKSWRAQISRSNDLSDEVVQPDVVEQRSV